MLMLIIKLIRLVELVVFARVALTWFMPSPPKALMPLIRPIDKILRPFSVVIPVGSSAGVDIGPVLFLTLLEVINRVIISVLYSACPLGF